MAWTRRALDLVFPPQCPVCGALVDWAGALCAACWHDITFINDPQCAACGLPFDFDLGPDALCGACVRRHPDYDRARAVMVYNEASRGLILDYKYGDRTEQTPTFGRWLARAGGELTADADLVVPVPLHWTRLFTRRFNQAALLAAALGRQCGTPVIPDLLVRRRRTPPQGRLGPAARRRNVAGAFAVKRGRAAKVAGQRILLVDDVLTTGATVSASARTLRAASAAGIDVLTLARVVRPVV